MSDIEERVIILAPYGADSVQTASLLRESGFQTVIARDEPELCALAREGAGVLLVAEEAFPHGPTSGTVDLLQSQPSWSDLPIIIVTTGGDLTQASLRAVSAFGESANLALIERPFRALTLIRAVQAAMRARRRQYQVRGMMDGLEDLVRDRTKRLEATIAELEAFSYTVSHDLRAPLRAMQGYSHYLIEEYAHRLDDQGRLFLERIRSASARLDSLVQDILTFSRFSKSDVQISPLDPEPLIRQVLESYSELHPANAEIVVRPPFLRVKGHEAFLTQCISNVLTNAVKFVAPGTRPRVEIWNEPIDGSVRVYFRDNGVGIDPSHQQRIFRIFERGPEAENYDGTGIGLAIVHKAVERMGGKVGLESQPGRGSTFWIELQSA
ncbi:MAG TPA: ATP-binding protein [Methylomirabilota bacterium]|nr:ATP-binding protein [Methylomirabilota bacterium]